jgi:uncharacterized protein (DUF849 family)
VLVKACLNGGLRRADHEAVPVTPHELARDGAAAVAAGAGALHLHPRGADGGESLAAADVEAAVTAVRGACPDVPLGVSTGLWITGGDHGRRLAEIERWGAIDGPDFASVNLSEDGSGEVAEVLRSAGVGVEAGLEGEADADLLASGVLGDELVRVLVEVPDRDGPAAVARAARIEAVLDAHAVGAPRLHHGFGAATWDVLGAAAVLGRDLRVGLEDTIVLPGGARAGGNAELVGAAVAIARGRR